MYGPIVIKSDASAAIGRANRIGIGKVRHIEVNQLWLQESVRGGEIEVIKVKSEEDLADALTKAIDANSLQWHIEMSGAIVMKNRHELMPEADYCKEEDEGIDEEE